jgi:hypothetical protein
MEQNSFDELFDRLAEESIAARPRTKATKHKYKRTMDDSIIFNEKTAKEEGVVFGVYGADDWVVASHTRKAIESSKNTVILKGTWITPATWIFVDWVQEVAKNFNFIGHNSAFLFNDWGLVDASHSRGKLKLEVNGSFNEAKAFIASVDALFKRAENLIEWIYSSRGDSISVPLSYREAVPGAYPWLPTTLEQYIDSYMDSAASVLILIGPPGTGKTTFIKNLIHRSGGDAQVTYDETVMSGDQLFAGFIESEAKFLIMEDADAFLKSRADGNTMMHRFLNVSDGLISAQDKKLVFSTNLPSIHDIDSALLRPGRCFDIIEFRALTRNEAKPIAEQYNLSIPDGPSITLGELFNTQPSGEASNFKRPMGFV